MTAAQAAWRPGMPLTEIEESMRACAQAGEVLDLLGGAVSPNAQTMRAWDESKTLRAAVLRHLLAQGEWPVDARGVRLRGLRIHGCLDLEAATIRCPLRAEFCAFDESHTVTLDFAAAPLIVLNSCWMAGLSATGLSV